MRLNQIWLNGLTTGHEVEVSKLPQSVQRFLRDFGAQVIYNQRFMDHHRFSADELNHLEKKAVEAKLDTHRYTACVRDVASESLRS